MLQIASMVWGVTDVERARAFWEPALGYRPRDADHDETWALLVPESGDGPQFALDRVTSDKPRRHHLDLYADDVDAEVDRLLALGATRDEHWDYPDDPDYVVLRDPDGNPFCVCERPSAFSAR
jgi:catechol 2,3-dioxygenase-like lactoylglutathione lyase family enzyme